MDKLSKARDKSLPEFQKFLLEEKLAPESNVPSYAHWVNRYLDYAKKHRLSVVVYQEGAVTAYLDALQSDRRIFKWQHRQANEALRLYFTQYLKKMAERVPSISRPADVTGLLKEGRRLIRFRHYSHSTERVYLQWIERFLDYVFHAEKKTKISDIATGDYKNFLVYLSHKRKVSSSTQNQAFNAIRFFFRNILGKEIDSPTTVREKRGQKLPSVLSLDEVKILFAPMSAKNRLVAELLYGAGLRLMELARLRVRDIDFDTNTIFVRSEKGGRDRTTILPSTVKDRLKEHLKAMKLIHEDDLAKGYGEVQLPEAVSHKYTKSGNEWAWQYVFPSARLSVDPRNGRVSRQHISDTAIQDMIKNALRKSGISKRASVHTLRHSFATHLLASGVNIRELQELLGHKNVETTMIYTRVVRNMSKTPQSPLDALYK
ncbi:MAG TPA: integron integrase [Syntrophales bacterium]|nr:integron integrase [Syntrophales bacterium]